MIFSYVILAETGLAAGQQSCGILVHLMAQINCTSVRMLYTKCAVSNMNGNYKKRLNSVSIRI